MSATQFSSPLGFRLTLLTGAVALAAGMALPAWADCPQGGPGVGGPCQMGPGMGGHGPGGHGPDGPGMWGHGMGGHAMGGGQGLGGHGMMLGNPEFLGRGIDHMLDGLNASAAQRTQIKQIAQTAVADLKTQRDAGRALHDKGLQLFAAPTIDAAAVEALRQQMLAQHDQASKRVTQAMLDIAKVLTPEQRAKLGERLKQRGEIMRERLQRIPQGSSAPKN